MLGPTESQGRQVAVDASPPTALASPKHHNEDLHCKLPNAGTRPRRPRSEADGPPRRSTPTKSVRPMGSTSQSSSCDRPIESIRTTALGIIADANPIADSIARSSSRHVQAADESVNHPKPLSGTLGSVRPEQALGLPIRCWCLLPMFVANCDARPDAVAHGVDPARQSTKCDRDPPDRNS